jgi:quercetin dioxygenase-like cupin family protein
MADYIYLPDLQKQAQTPAKGILSQTVQEGQGTKTVLFGFAAGQELSPHAAPYPALITILKGEASLLLGEDWKDAAEGSFAWMPPNLQHGLKAKTEVVMLLTMVKGGA